MATSLRSGKKPQMPYGRQMENGLSWGQAVLSQLSRRMEISWLHGPQPCPLLKGEGVKMSLRVITGKAKGRKLKSVPGDTTRPITDRAKESLFNILAGDVIDSNWWDLFGGTGAVGIEALSRGARAVRFTDMNRAPIETIRFNVEHCGLSGQSEIRRGDAFTLLSSTAD